MPTESIAIKVVVKVRPFIEDGKGKKIIKTSSDKVTIEGNGKDQTFSFDYAFGENIKLSDVYRECCAGLVQRAMLGYNVSVMALGATGSGKSHMLAGNDEDIGVVPCIIRGIYNYINEMRGKKSIFVTASFIEVLDEKLTDMLNPHTNQMNIRDHPQLDIYVDGLSELVAQNEDDLLRWYTQGNRARLMDSTDLNIHRTRSTGIFFIHIEQRETGSNNIGLRATMSIADVAGIEADVGAKNVINVVNAMKKNDSLPYRDSKVTRLLQQSFGGNTVCLVLLALSPADSEYQASMQTLQLGQSMRGIKNKIKVNLNEAGGLIEDLRGEIARLRNTLARGKDPNKEDVLKLEGMIQDLQIAKKQAREEKEKLSAKYEEERKINLANRGILDWVMDSAKRGNKEIQERIILLQKEKDQLTLQYKDKRNTVDDMKEVLQKNIADYSKLADKGKVSENETKKRVTDIHELKEKLKRETEALKDLKKRLKEVQDKQQYEKERAQGVSFVKGNAELRYIVEAEERRKFESENKALIAEELEKAKLETKHIKAEIQMRQSQGKNYSMEEGIRLETELADLRADKPVVALQLQALQQEKERLQNDLDLSVKRHKDELEIQQLQHFQTFREYRLQFEQQKALLDQRYRKLVEDAVQDAIYLSSRNTELTQENTDLQQQIAELKDKLCVAEAGGNK